MSSTVVVMSVDAGPAQIQAVVQLVERAGGAAFVSRGVERTIIGLVGDVERFASLPIADLAGVENVVRVSRSFKLVSRESHRTPSAVHIGPTTIGRDRFTLIAGPCAVEDADQALAAAWMARRAGAALLRGGAFKPRTSPYSFQGLGEQGLEILAECRRQTGLPLVTEVLDVAHAERVAAVADMLQIGTRNMANYTLLKEVGRAGKPVLLKRGMSATIEEWLMAAEYVAQEGNLQIVLCERGIRTFEPSVRNTLDLTAVLLAHDLSHLPVIVDPSHAAGRRDLVVALARGAAAIGADGVMVDVHPYPERARVDGPQALVESDLDGLAGDLRALATLTGRQWVEPPAVRAPAGAAPTG